MLNFAYFGKNSLSKHSTKCRNMWYHISVVIISLIEYNAFSVCK